MFLLENNGRASSSKRTKHLNIRYFYHQPNQKGGPSYWVLSHRKYGRGFFYQTSSRQEISSVQKIDYESIGLKYALTKGVCWESTSFILSKLFNVWIPVTLTSCFISNTRMDYLLFKIDYSAFTIWHIFYDYHWYIELFACKDVRITHNYYSI